MKITTSSPLLSSLNLDPIIEILTENYALLQ